MARSVKTTRPSAGRTSEPAPKKRIGRPPGSKNKVRATAPTRSKQVAAAPAKRAPARKAAAAAAPKLSKAELEQQVVTLERTIARLRKQNTELKQAAREEDRQPAKTGSASAKGAKRTTKATAAPTSRRNARSVAEPIAPAPDEEEVPAPAAAGKTSRRGAGSRKRAAAASVEDANDHDGEPASAD